MADEPGTSGTAPPPGETPPSSESGGGLSRRQLLVGAGAAGLVIGGAVSAGVVLALDDDGSTTAAAPGQTVTQVVTEQAPAATEAAESMPAMTEEPAADTAHEGHTSTGTGAPLATTTLTADQGTALAAIYDRFMPVDDLGPSGSALGAVAFIDRMLGADPTQADFYALGLESLDAFSQEQHQGNFADLTPEQQDEILGAMEADEATGFVPSSSPFFEAVREHSLHAMFSDPYYGGNVGSGGWSLIGFPGVRLAISPDEQAIDGTQQVVAGSIYDTGAFGAAPREG